MAACKAKQKGYRTVARIRKKLVSRDYIVSNLEKNGPFAKEKDLFGLWDLIAVHKKVQLFIQSKTNKEIGIRKLRKWITPYTDFGKKHGSKCVRYEIWNKRDNKNFEILDCNTKKRTIEQLQSVKMKKKTNKNIEQNIKSNKVGTSKKKSKLSKEQEEELNKLILTHYF